MTKDEAQALGKRVVRESSGVSVRFGCTNGRHCLHLITANGSETIYSEREWANHARNRSKTSRAARSPFSALRGLTKGAATA